MIHYIVMFAYVNEKKKGYGKVVLSAYIFFFLYK